MRKYISFLLSLILLCNFVSSQELSYYLPDSIQYDPSVPKPEEVIHHHVGEWHVTHDRLVNYMEALADAVPSRIKLEMMGYTYEKRPQVLLIITSPNNHLNLEQIRQQHIRLTDPAASDEMNTSQMPVVVYIGHSIHGNESSGSNAALLSAYYLAAAKGKHIDELLENVVILFDPSFNPDGLQRFSTWANQHKSRNLVTDPNSREFHEVWPGGRYNHYWFDLNRDWLPAQHVESQNRLAWFHKWKPNILTDHHEQGSNATFFFQPGVPSRVNPLTPAMNQVLTARMAKFHAAFLDRIGSLYFTRENYDDFYYGKGSTYPDVNGAVGILFEQASSRGHAQETSNGILTFPFTIRNQFITTLSTLEAAKTMRKDFLDWQKEFYRSAISEAIEFPVKGYVFGDADHAAETRIFIEMLRRHQIEVYELNSDLRLIGNEFTTKHSFIVPTAQSQFRLIRGIFEKNFTFRDSLFYDITTWTMPLAFGIPYAEVSSTQASKNLLGKKITELPPIKKAYFIKSNYAYLMEWNQFYAPAALNEILNAGLITRVATRTFETGQDQSSGKFTFGTIQVPVGIQKISSQDLYDTLLGIADKYDLVIHPVHSGNVFAGIDMGSSNFQAVKKPEVAMIVGTGVNALDAGEVWHLLDQRFNVPVSHLEIAIANRVDLGKYNTLIMVGGNYAGLNKEIIKSWVQGGGTLILTEEAVTWASQNGISQVNFKKTKSVKDSTQIFAYTDRPEVEGAQRMSGAIFGATVDLTHPLAYGYTTPYVSMFKANKVFMEKSKSPYATPFYYKDAPLQSGWLSRENYDLVKNSAAVVVNTVGGGRVISIADNPNLRAFWLGGSRLMMNAIFFGRIIDAGSARVE